MALHAIGWSFWEGGDIGGGGSGVKVISHFGDILTFFTRKLKTKLNILHILILTSQTFLVSLSFNCYLKCNFFFFFCLSSQFSFHSLLSQGVFMGTQFYSGFSCSKPLVWETVVETGDEFSIIYIFITLFVNNVHSKFNNISNFVFHCKKQNKISRNHIFNFFFPVFKNRN